jgi:hypothetical protein
VFECVLVRVLVCVCVCVCGCASGELGAPFSLGQSSAH